VRRAFPSATVLLSAAAALVACNRSTPPAGEGAQATAPAAPAAAPPPPGAVRVLVAYGSEKKAWLEEQIAAFNASGARLPSGAPLVAEGKAMGSGEAMQDVLEGRLKPVVFSPASGAYVTLLNEAWQSQAGHTAALAPAGDSIVLSPIVIAMWRPMAEALGWPRKHLGWSDIIAVGRERTGWSKLGRPEWGAFKLGHTHPEFSNSGLLAVLAEAYAGAGKTRALAAADIRAAKTHKFMHAVESSIVHYGKSTGFFAEKMVARGPSYLSAAVLYENLVIESYGPGASPEAAPRPKADLPLVAIYPREGTFWSDHPFCVLGEAPWVTGDQKKGAALLLAWLKRPEAQQRAVALGFRPVDPSVAVGAPIDAAHGADPKQPQTLLELPSAATMQALLDVWREVKKPSDVTLVFDKSGSMRGAPLAEAKAGARAFLASLQPRDQSSIVFFDNNVYAPLGPMDIATGRAELTARVDGVLAEGGTALYDAVATTFAAARDRAKAEPDRIHALVVMTDGRDESSQRTLDALKAALPPREEASPVKIFTIAYGKEADTGPLEVIAEMGDGSQTKGDVENIVQIYRDIASFF
jgi:Ca-activated chloride channel family protein